MRDVGAKRILVYGVTGSGKTTLASRISELTGIPWHAIDDLAYAANWQTTSVEFQREKVAEICARDEWIIDTAYSKWIEIPLSRAELIVGLDYPRWFSFWRLVRRTAARIVDKKPICNGNTETLRQAFSKESIILWHFRSFKRKRGRIRGWAANPGGFHLSVFRSARATERWLNELPAANDAK